ncbi:hypothetical protein [Novosphingobium resinovorum]|uniref:ATP-dependent DNA ligase n=1 Tax=Novosphingobium resinovorum TaxID=158500 RepID=UPI003AF35056
MLVFGGASYLIGRLGLPPCLIDREIIARRLDGNPDFSSLQTVLKRGKGSQNEDQPLEFQAFDLLELDGEDPVAMPNIQRKERLEALLADAEPPIFVADQVIGAGEKLYDVMCGAGQEGIIAKRIDAPYLGRRTKDRLKVKCTRRCLNGAVFLSISFVARSSRSASGFASSLWRMVPRWIPDSEFPQLLLASYPRQRPGRYDGQL